MTGIATTGTILDRIIARTAIDVAERKRVTSLPDLERLTADRRPALDFRQSLAKPGLAVIAEIKRGSPSRGRFPVGVDPAEVSAEYLAGGAAAISVLTDAPFFHGSLADMEMVAALAHAYASPAPVLRKDFVIDLYQVVEARAHGADAILLIVAALDDTLLAGLLDASRGLGMEALVEVHDEREMRRAAAVGATTIGINNRDLRDFRIDLGTTERLVPLAPPSAVLVGESGVFTPDDAARLRRAGVDAVLVGEGLIMAPDRLAAIRALVGGSVDAPQQPSSVATT